MLASASNPIFHRFNIGMDSVLFQYPQTGKSEVHMYVSTGGNLLSRSPGATGIMKAMLSPKFEFFVALDPWMEPDDMFADIILPTVTNFERDDVSHWRQYEIYCTHAIDPLFEAKSDWDIWVEIANRMGVADKFLDGKPTVEAWLHDNFDKVTTIGKHISWEDFKAKGYWEWTIPDSWQPAAPSAGWTWKGFHDDPSEKQTRYRIRSAGNILHIDSSNRSVGAIGLLRPAGFQSRRSRIRKAQSRTRTLCVQGFRCTCPIQKVRRVLGARSIRSPCRRRIQSSHTTLVCRMSSGFKMKKE